MRICRSRLRQSVISKIGIAESLSKPTNAVVWLFEGENNFLAPPSEQAMKLEAAVEESHIETDNGGSDTETNVHLGR